jgi:hypothetical protein
MDLHPTRPFESPLIRRSAAARSRIEAVPASMGVANARSQKMGVGNSEIAWFFEYQLGTPPRLKGFEPGFPLPRKLLNMHRLFGPARIGWARHCQRERSAISSRKLESGTSPSRSLQSVVEGICFPSTKRGPVILNFGSAAMCSDALRCAGSRSSGGLLANFHGDNTGSNPVGDANSITSDSPEKRSMVPSTVNTGPSSVCLGASTSGLK